MYLLLQQAYIIFILRILIIKVGGTIVIYYKVTIAINAHENINLNELSSHVLFYLQRYNYFLKSGDIWYNS